MFVSALYATPPCCAVLPVRVVPASPLKRTTHGAPLGNVKIVSMIVSELVAFMNFLLFMRLLLQWSYNCKTSAEEHSPGRRHIHLNISAWINNGKRGTYRGLRRIVYYGRESKAKTFWRSKTRRKIEHGYR